MCKIINNVFISLNSTGYSVMIGSETSYASNNYMKYILVENNKFSGALEFAATPPNTTHGLMVGFQQNPLIRNNVIKGHGIGLVSKGSNTNDTLGLISYNIFDNNVNDAYFKGTVKNRFYNNTLKRGKYTIYNIRLSLNTGSDASVGNDFKNNIILTDTTAGVIYYVVDNSSQLGFTGNNNLLFKTGNYYINFETALHDYAYLVANGCQTDGLNQNPNFKSASELWPITTLNNGYPTGSNVGIDINSILNSKISIPQIKLKLQTGTYKIGAFIQ
jgi:hypothetical protein